MCFALDESFSIYGGNLKSTMAGEFSFSIALSLMILGFGLLAHGMQTGRFRSWAAIVLALAVVCHGIVAIYTALGALVIVLVNTDGLEALLVRRHRRRWARSCCRRSGSGRSCSTTTT